MRPESASLRESSGSAGRDKKREASNGVVREERLEAKSEKHNAIEESNRPAAAQIRRSAYGPDFLKQFTGGSPDGYHKDGENNFKVITGREAATFYDNFVGDDNSGNPVTQNLHDPKSAHRLLPPVVFAYTVQDAGRKVIDYYMTWRGKTKTRRMKGKSMSPLATCLLTFHTGLDRRLGFLDSEFKKVAKTLDKEFKRVSLLGATTANNKATPLPAPGPIDTAKPETLTLPVPAIPEASGSNRASVISLPLLNMVRGVPLGNRLPLRVTNPDSASMMSSTASVRDSMIREQNVPELTSKDQVGVPLLPNIDTPQNSDEQSDHRKSKEPQRFSLLGSLANWSSSANALRGHKKEKSSKSTDEDKPEMVIVLLDEKDNQMRSWHGLEKRLSTKRYPARANSGRNSPWRGSLVPSDESSYYSPRKSYGSYESDSSDDSSDYEWKDAPVIPMKPLLTMHGYIPPEPYPVMEPPVAPVQAQYMFAAGHASPPISYGGPQSYPSPHHTYSSYAPSWVSQSPQSYTPLSSIPQWVSTPEMGYSSPYVHGYHASY